jgi:hypothetical protein
MPIKLNDPDALERLQKKLNARLTSQENMKEINKILRNPKLTAEEKIKTVMEKYQLDTKTIHGLMNPHYSFDKPGYPAWAMQNNNAEIARLKKRINEVLRYQQEAVATEESGELPELVFDGGRIVDNVPENRLQIFFDAKPDAETRTRLKQNGFRWTPSNSAWQSYRNPHTLNWAKREFKVE